MLEILYRPRLANNKYAPLNWGIQFYRWTNIICWPLADNVPAWIFSIDRFLWFLGFVGFVIHNDGELRYLRVNFNNIDELLTGVPTYLVLIELHLRVFSLGWRKTDFKNLLKKFYAEIYIERLENSKHFTEIQRQMLPIAVVSLLYFCAVNSYILTAVYVLATGKNNNDSAIFYTIFFSNIWVGFIVTTMMFGEANCLGLLIFHLNGRYLMMEKTFNDKVNKILKSGLNNNIALHYERALVATLKENLRLNKFASEIQNEFTFRIFVMFSFSAVTLCVLGFKVYTSPLNSTRYWFWALGKILELLAFGEMGSTFIKTTDRLGSMYYESKWELVVERSSNSQQNVKLMKFINLCIVTNQKPFQFTGLNFITVSLHSVMAVLQGAGSYFTCLISLR